MSKFKPMELIKTMSGKFHGDSEYYAAERLGTQYTGKIGENNTPPTEKQVHVRADFKTARMNVLTLSQEEKSAYAEAFKKNPGKYKSLHGYMIAMEYKKIGE